MDHLEPPVTWGQESIQLLVRERERKPLFVGALVVLLAGTQAVSKEHERGKPAGGAVWWKASTCWERPENRETACSVQP